MAIPITRIIRVPEGRRYLMLEFRVSATAADGRGLRISSEWMREAPKDGRERLVVH